MVLKASCQHAKEKAAERGNGDTPNASGAPNERAAQRRAAHLQLSAKDSGIKSLLQRALEAERAFVRDITTRSPTRRPLTRSRTKKQAIMDAASTAFGPAAPAVPSSETHDPSSDPITVHTPLPRHARAGDTARERVHFDHHGQRHREQERSLGFFDAEFLRGSDHTVSLTRKQREHYELIFRLNDHSSPTTDGIEGADGLDGARGTTSSLRIAELSRYMESLGHGVPTKELVYMMHEEGIAHASEDGAISLQDFLEFIRRSMVSDIPASKVLQNPMNSRTLVPFQHQVLKLYPSHDLPSCIYQVPHVRRLFSSAASYESRNSRTDTRSYAAGSAMGSLSPAGNTALPPVPTSSLPFRLAPKQPRVSSKERSPPEGSWSDPNRGGGSMWGRPSSVPTAESERATDGARYTSGHSPTRSSAGLQSIGVGAAVAGGSASELELVGKAAIEGMLRELGCALDEATFTEIFDEVDSDGDGNLVFDEFVTALGMLKRNVLEVMELEQAFTRLRAASRKPGAANSSAKADGRPEHAVYVSDLVVTLGIEEWEAEEMIFIADLKDDQQAGSEKYIDFTEFKQVVVNWSN